MSVSRSSTRERDRERASEPRGDRGQATPLVALVAAWAACLGLALYGAYLAGALPAADDRSVERPTLDRVWDDVEVDGAYRRGALDARVDPAGLPEGYAVAVTVTRFDDGGRSVVDRIHYDADRRRRAAVDPPADARTATRPIPVRAGDGDVRGGELRVEVWS